MGGWGGGGGEVGWIKMVMGRGGGVEWSFSLGEVETELHFL